MEALNEFLEFIRLRVCVFGAFIALSAYVIFNETSGAIFLVGAGAFFISATTYSYNMLIDKEEDQANKGRLNKFVENGKGKWITAAAVCLGLYTSILISTFAFLVGLILMTANIAYSYFRVKKVFPVKNLFTAGMSAPLFIYGAGAAAPAAGVIAFCAALFFVVLTASFIGDLRDYAGDKKAELQTFATKTGCAFTKKACYLSLAALLALTFSMKLTAFYVLAPFAISVLLLLLNDRVNTAHKYLMMSVLCIPIPFIL